MYNCELKNTEEKGEGLYALKQFKRGDLIMKCQVEDFDAPNSIHSSQVGMNRFMLFSGLGQKINHSCDPTCGIQCDEDLIHKYVAFKDIEVGEELTYDYAMGNYTVDNFPKCQCRSENCRVEINGYKGLSEERKKEYAGFIAPYLVEYEETQKEQKFK